jgi:hypothetical protein
MAYAQFKGRKPFERASKIAHSEILNNPDVQAFVESCTLPSAPDSDQLDGLQTPLPKSDTRIRCVIAVDGGLTEVAVREEFPSASLAFMTFGPLLLDLKDLDALDCLPFIGPEDMARLKSLTRFSLSIPTKAIRAKGALTFSAGVRRTIQEFLFLKHKELGTALQWLMFRGWNTNSHGETWEVPRCPNSTSCIGANFEFSATGPIELTCSGCLKPVYLADGLRLYERIDDEQGAAGIMSYLLTTLEQLVVVNIIRTLLSIKPSTLREILLIKDGPLAFFGMVAPLRKPMQELMMYLSDKDNGRPLICLVGLEKSGAFVEHAVRIEPNIDPGNFILLNNDYIYKYILPGDASGQPFGSNTYYGEKVIFKSHRGDVYVATIPAGVKSASVMKLEDLQNGAEVLKVVSELRCSMYDHALVPIVLANKLVSLADFPSSEILARFVKSKVAGM